MHTRKLGNTDLELSAIGFGAWAIGGGNWEWGWGPQNDRDSIAAIERALELGVNWIDTAAAYGLGHSEEVVGKAIRKHRNQVIVATKCGQTFDDPKSGKTVNRLNRQSIRKDAEGSLRRLRVDKIDLYQIHWPIPDADIEEAWTEIARLIEEGKVRYGGVSNFSVSQLQRVQAIHPVAALQPPYSLLDRLFEDQLMGFCAENHIGVVAYSPMASGLLTGKYTQERIAALPPEDWRRTSAEHFREPELSINLEFIDQLKLIADRFDRSIAQLAVAWVLRQPMVTSAIVGVRRPDQIEAILPAADWELPPNIIAEINLLLNARNAALMLNT